MKRLHVCRLDRITLDDSSELCDVVLGDAAMLIDLLDVATILA